MIRVLLADDHALLREGIADLLREEADIEVVGEAPNGRVAVDLARDLKPDVVVMDVTMPELDGVTATRLLASELPQTRVIGLSMHDADYIGKAMLSAGAFAYLSKGGSCQDLVAAIRSAARAA